MLYGCKEVSLLQVLRFGPRELLLMTPTESIHLRQADGSEVADDRWIGNIHDIEAKVNFIDIEDTDTVEVIVEYPDGTTLGQTLTPIHPTANVEPLYDIYQKLCTRDRRNVYYDGIYGWFDADDLEDMAAPRSSNCCCDSCFSGNDELAMTILRLLSA